MFSLLLLVVGTIAFIPFRKENEDLLIMLREPDIDEGQEKETFEKNKEKEITKEESVEAKKTSKKHHTTSHVPTPTTAPEDHEKTKIPTPNSTEEPLEKDKITTSRHLLTTTTENPEDHRNVTVCEDQFPRCSTVKRLCEHKLYEKIMTISCAKTCGFCFVGMPLPHRCRDIYPEQCASWGGQGFCHAFLHSQPEKVEICMKTCGLC